MGKITNIEAIELLDSRGNPTIGAKVELDGNVTAIALVPSGASTGEKEAVELRDEDKKRYLGKGVLKAVNSVNTEIKQRLIGMRSDDQRAVDMAMIELDGTANKARLGANAVLAVSMACARASALEHQLPLYKYLGGANACVLPVPCMNIINGGRHADNTVDFQEFMIAPHNAPSFKEAIRMGIETFHTLKGIIKSRGYSTAVGDEGGFAPQLKTNEEAMELIMQAIEKAGYRPGEDISICLDPAASEMWEDGKYQFFKSDKSKISSDELISLWQQWADKYPIVLLEDGLAENDWQGWNRLTKLLGSKIELVGDDIFCTNASILQKGIDAGVANSVLIKLNQIGSVTETLDTIQLAQKNNYYYFISHRSGETEDTTIADLTVATAAGHIKTGSGCRSERIAKYNRFLWIEQELGNQAVFAGKRAFQNR